MRKLIIYLVIIFLFFLPTITLAEESFIVKPLPSLMNELDSKNKKIYKELCNLLTIEHVNLNILFMTDHISIAQHPDNEWRAICERAKVHIKRGGIIMDHVPKGSNAYIEGVYWFSGIWSLFQKLESQGTRAFSEKVKVGRIMWYKNESLKRNRTIKKHDQDDIDSFDKMIGSAKSFQNTDDEEEWLKEYKSKNSGKTFRQELLEAQIYSKNVVSAVLRTKKAITESAKDDEPDRYKGGENYLDSWAIDNEYKYFSNFKNVRFSWQESMKLQHSEYEKVYEKWYDELEYIFKDTIFKNTSHMKGWTWNTFDEKFSEVVLATEIYRN